jgi:hypothetical protein
VSLFLTAAAGHRAAEREISASLSAVERFLVSRLFRYPKIVQLLEERFRARVLHRWGRFLEDAQCDRTIFLYR